MRYAIKLFMFWHAASVLVGVPSLGVWPTPTGKRIAFSNNYAGNSWRQAMLKSYGIVAKKDRGGQNRRGGGCVHCGGQGGAHSGGASPEPYPRGLRCDCDQCGVAYRAQPALSSRPVTPVLWWCHSTDSSQRRARTELWVDTRIWAGRKSSRWQNSSPRVATCWKFGAWPERRSMLPSCRHRCRVKEHPNFKIVASVNGDWDQTTAQKAVATILPSLPPLAGVVDQGGDGYGAAQAFVAAHKALPTIIMGNRQDELAWWKEQKDKTDIGLGRPRLLRHLNARVLGRATAAKWQQKYPP